MASTFTPLKATAFVIDDEFGVTVAERIRQSLNSLAFRSFELGGLVEGGIDGTGAQIVREYRIVELPGADLQGFTVRARVQVRTDSASTSATPFIYDLTSAATFATGSAVTSLTFAEQTIALTIPVATRKYQLRVTKSNANALVYAVGVIEFLLP